MTYPQTYGANPYMPQPAQPQWPQHHRRLDFVMGEGGMESFYVAPGEVVPLFDTSSATMWLKSANESGVPSVVRYTLVEDPAPKADADPTTERLDAMERSIRDMREAIDALAVSDVRPTAKPRHAGGQAGAADGGREPAGAV